MQALINPTPHSSEFIAQLEAVIKSDPGKTTNSGKFVQILQNALPCEVSAIKVSKLKGEENDFGDDSTVFKCAAVDLKNVVAIKIVTNTWQNSETIYNDPELFNTVNDLPCTSNILATFTCEFPNSWNPSVKRQFRVVIYDFVQGHLSKDPHDVAQIASCLKSIGMRFVGTASDIIIRDADQQAILTDWDSIEQPLPHERAGRL